MSGSSRELAPLPPDDEVVEAVRRLMEDPRVQRHGGASASSVAYALGIQPARRHGRGAVKGSWTGYMAPALRISPRLRALTRAGRLVSWYDLTSDRTRLVYRIPGA